MRYERMRRDSDEGYMDVDQLEMVIDFYLEAADIDLLEDAVAFAERLFPESNEIVLRRAHLYSVKGQPEKALSLLKELDKKDPCNTDVMYAMGTVYGMLDQPRKAIQYYQLASADGCELGMVFGNMGDEYYKMDDLSMAVKYYKKSIDKNPEEERSLCNLAATLDEMGKNEEAATYFHELVKEHPYSKYAWYSLGNAYMQLNLLEHAVDSFEYALAIDKTLCNAYYCMADCYFKLKEYGKAVESFREALNYAEDKSVVNFSIGLIFKECKNYSSAVVYLRKAVQDDAYYGDAWMELSRCYEAMGDKYTALEMIERAISVCPQSSEYVWQAAHLYDVLGDIAKADQLYQCMLHLDEDVDENWLDYADFLMRQQRYEDAIDILSRGVVNATMQLAFNARLAVCYFKTGKRNFLYNAIRSCMNETAGNVEELFCICPEMKNDAEILAIVRSI